MISLLILSFVSINCYLIYSKLILPLIVFNYIIAIAFYRGLTYNGIVLSKRDYKKVVTEMKNKRPPNNKLKKAFKEHDEKFNRVDN